MLQKKKKKKDRHNVQKLLHWGFISHKSFARRKKDGERNRVIWLTSLFSNLTECSMGFLCLQQSSHYVREKIYLFLFQAIKFVFKGLAPKSPNQSFWKIVTFLTKWYIYMTWKNYSLLSPGTPLFIWY